MSLINNDEDVKKKFENYFGNFEDYNSNVIITLPELNNNYKTLYKLAFLQKYQYILQNADQNEANINTIQWKIARDKFVENMLKQVQVNKNKNLDLKHLELFKDNIISYGGIPESLLPAVYVPFYQSAIDNGANINFNLLTLDDSIPDNFFRDTYKSFPADTETEYLQLKIDFKDNLQKVLQDQIKELNNSNKVYNNFSLQTMIIFVCILWFIIIITLLKIVYYYYFSYYNVIIIVMTIMLLITAIIWKMTNILRS